jgi:hypothetical protein
MARQRFQMQVLAGFAAMALLLALVGLYGLMSYMLVSNRVAIGSYDTGRSARPCRRCNRIMPGRQRQHVGLASIIWHFHDCFDEVLLMRLAKRKPV